MKAALLADRGVVKVAGDDARKFLNGLLTTDVAKITPERAAFAALLTPQGKIMVDMIVAEAPTYPTYQWRTPVIAATMIMRGEPVPREWVLPQPEITSENLARYVNPNMPPLHYALCGCESMPGYPEYWGGHR